MSRTAPRLRLEPCEDRSLPAAGLFVNTPPIDPAQLSHMEDEDEDDEYATPASSEGRAGAKMSPADAANAQVVAYIAETYPAIPPTPAGPAPPPPAAPPGLPTATLPVPTLTAVAPVPPPASVPTPAPSQPPVEQVVPRTTGDDTDDRREELPPTPLAEIEDPPVVSESEFPPAGLVNFPPLGDLSLHADLGRWGAAVGRLLDGLDTNFPDAESPWARLGYWALAVGAVGVSVELTRQGLRVRRPEPVDGPPLPVAR